MDKRPVESEYSRKSGSSCLLAQQVSRASKKTKTWKAVVLYLLERDGVLCLVCTYPIEYEEISIDHIHPRSRGGEDRLDNFQLLHLDCNQGKGNKTTTKPRSSRNELVVAGIIPKGLSSKSPEYKQLYREARGRLYSRWWRRNRDKVGFGRRFSRREWRRVQDAVYRKVWNIRVEKGEEAALEYFPMIKESIHV